MTSIHFFDDHFLAVRRDMTRRVGQPRRVGEYRDPYPDTVDLVSCYPHAFIDPETGRWRMLYNSYFPDGAPHQNLLLVAESDDGIKWEPYDTTSLIELADRILPHQVLPAKGYREAVTFRDEHAPAGKRLKALVRQAGESLVYTSADGIVWQREEGLNWIEGDVDLPAAVFWNAERESYVITCRPRMADRRVAVIETRDWKTYSKPEVALQPDALDTPLAEFYGMPVVRVGDAYVGLLWIYHTDGEQLISNHEEAAHQSANKYLDGKVDCQIAYGFNGWHFQRTLRTAFAGGTELDAGDSGVANPYSVVDLGDHMLIFASNSRTEHGRRPVGSSSIGIYRLRRDGFAYLESSGYGSVTTRALTIGETLEINVECPWGEARAELIGPFGEVIEGFAAQDCVPFTGDATNWSPTWRGGNVAVLVGRSVRLRISLRHGRLYAVHGDFTVLVGPEVRQRYV